MKTPAVEARVVGTARILNVLNPVLQRGTDRPTAMNSLPTVRASTTPRPWRFALLEILAAIGIALWCLHGLSVDESTMGTIYYTWGFIGATGCLLVPGLLLLARLRWPQVLAFLFLPIAAMYYLPAILFGLWQHLAGE